MKNTSESIKKNNSMQQKLMEINNLVNAKPQPAAQEQQVKQIKQVKSEPKEPKETKELKEPKQPPKTPSKHNPRGIDVPTNNPSPVSKYAPNSPYANLIKKLNSK